MNFSPGVITSCFELLELVTRHRLTFPEVRVSFQSIGVVPTGIVIESTTAMGWVRVGEDGYSALTPAGERLLGLGSHPERLRRAILDYIDVQQPIWVQNASFGRAKLLAFAGSAIAQVFLEAGLVDGTDDDTVAFWDTLAGRARGQKDDRLLSIGRDGERLTIAYEEDRTGKRPRWIALESNADGYDILSIMGPSDPRSLSIEVKTTTIGSSGSLYLSRNEWERALQTRNHVFHIWDMSKRSAKRLAVVTHQDIEPHIPADRGEGDWKAMLVPIGTFEMFFRAI